MAALGKPAITTPRALDLRAVQDAVTSARQRIEALEREVARVSGQAGQTSFSGGGGSSTSNATTAALQTQITNLAAEVTDLQAVIDALLALDNGLVTVADGVLTSRVLTAGAGVTINDGDGAAGNPTIISTGGSGGDVVLYDDIGRALLTRAGQALLVGT